VSDPSFSYEESTRTRGSGATTSTVGSGEAAPIPKVPPEHRADPESATSAPKRLRNPLENVTAEGPRTHPVAYAALALAALALLLSLLGLGGGGGGYRQVKVGTNDCVIGPPQDGVDVLYCRVPNVP
jgi:hypothetical protein